MAAGDVSPDIEYPENRQPADLWAVDIAPDKGPAVTPWT